MEWSEIIEWAKKNFRISINLGFNGSDELKRMVSRVHWLNIIISYFEVIKAVYPFYLKCILSGGLDFVAKKCVYSDIAIEAYSLY